MPRDYTKPGVFIGRPRFGQVHFPEGAKESVRKLALVDEVTILRYAPEDDGGGAPGDTYKADELTVLGRVDVAAGAGQSDLGRQQEGTISEATTHVVTLYPGTGVTAKDRVQVGGHTFRVTAEPVETDPWVTTLEVREI